MIQSAHTIRSLLDAAAQRRPGGTYALATESGHTLTFAELQAKAHKVAAWLLAQDTRPGDTIALVLPNGLGTLQWLLGAMQGGWCVNPVNLLMQPEGMRYVLEHSDCKLVLASAEWADRLRGVVPGLPVHRVDPDATDVPEAKAGPSGPSNTSKTTNPEPPAPDAVALLMYTSGTTGRPKGVMLTQSNLAANAQAIVAEHALTSSDRVLGVLPLYHINAFAVTMLAPLASGGSVAMAPRFSAVRFWAQATGCGCTWINVVPTIISFLLEGAAPDRAETARIRFCRSASAALPPEHLRGFEAKFGIGVIETMGLTETVAPAFSNPLDPAFRKLGSVGRASGGEARVVDAQLRPLPDGSTGEVAIRGPHVMAGYYKDAQATAAAFTPDGWLRTGDLGHRDADGFFFITGRIKELIIKGGENIAPREVDEALLQHPAVLEVAVVGIPDRHYGQEIMACVVLREGAAHEREAGRVPLADELAAHCTLALGRYKTPSVWRFVSDLPRGPSGKVQRLKLVELHL
jgi:long-chain acyl-CoA synthetase